MRNIKIPGLDDAFEVEKVRTAALNIFDDLKEIPVVGRLLGSVAFAAVIAVGAENIKGTAEYKQFKKVVRKTVKEMDGRE